MTTSKHKNAMETWDDVTCKHTSTIITHQSCAEYSLAWRPVESRDMMPLQ